MGPFTEIVLRDIDRISDSYATNITEPSRLLERVSDILREENKLIVPFESAVLPEGASLAAIDGGNGHEKLAGGDLIVAGAALGEGAFSSKKYSDSDFPSDVFVSVLPHTSSNEDAEKTIRALLELQILAECGTDYRIIDGDYLGNVSNVLYGLNHRDPKVVNLLLGLIVSDFDGRLDKAFGDILIDPDMSEWNGIIAVPKSDSSSFYVRNHLSEYNLGEHGFTDRLFASRVLNPGEFLLPRVLESNQALISSLEKSFKSPNYLKDISDRQSLNKILKDKPEALRRLGSGSGEYGILWTTYFKPSAWDKFSGVLKVEFVHPPNSSMSLLDHTKFVVQIVDQDILDKNVLEPWSQFHADRRAKDVSNVLTIVKNHLLQSTDSVSDAMGLIRKYRT